jgi:hypothetical protein
VSDLALLAILLLVAAWLASHDHRLDDKEPVRWDAVPRKGSTKRTVG